jgi:hypothetical protein
MGITERFLQGLLSLQRSRIRAVGESGRASRSIMTTWQTRFAGVYGEPTSWVTPKRQKVDYGG